VFKSPDSSKKLSEDCDDSIEGDIMTMEHGVLMNIKIKRCRAASEQHDEA
jgi:hypothetical protein